VMRILVASDQWFPDYRGGSARVAAATAQGLAARGHRVTVLAPRHRGQPGSERDEHGVEVLRVLGRRSIVPQTIADVVESAVHARRLRASGFDVVMAHQTTVGVGVAAALRAPLSLVYHASAPREHRFLLERQRGLGSQARLRALSVPIRRLDRRAVARADSILTLSAYTESLLAADHGDSLPKIERVSGGVDTGWFQPDADPSGPRTRLGVGHEPLLVTVRRLEPRMGIENLLEAMGLLRHRDHGLIVVGDGTLRPALERMSRELGLEGRVRFVGLVTESALRDWYRAADAVALPTVAYEGFGLTTAEALACGTAVVGTPVGATPELLTPLDPRLLAAGTAPAELAEALDRGLDLVTPDFRARCREYAVSRYAWESVVPLWEAALETTARRSAPPPGRLGGRRS
jgi:glycosyltransferase involved in cell wall biosynthesis